MTCHFLNGKPMPAFVDGRQMPEAALALIVGRLHRLSCSVYLGTLAVLVGRSLADTLEMLTELQHRGEVQRVPGEAELWELAGPAVLARAQF